MKRTIFQSISGLARVVPDLLITLLLWLYYTAGFLMFFAVFYVAAYLFSSQRETAFQNLNHHFYKSLFGMIRLLMPWRKLQIQAEVKAIRSAVIVCNHLSYLDPLLLMAIYPKHKTIVKSSFFHVPIFSRLLVLSGHMPSDATGGFTNIFMRQMETMGAFLASGGNLFVFPEGTRSRDGRLGDFNKGAFKIAKMLNAPIAVLYVDKTDTLFQPGRFLFNTCGRKTITLDWIGTIPPAGEHEPVSTSDLMDRARSMLEHRKRGSVKGSRI